MTIAAAEPMLDEEAISALRDQLRGPLLTSDDPEPENLFRMNLNIPPRA